MKDDSKEYKMVCPNSVWINHKQQRILVIDADIEPAGFTYIGRFNTWNKAFAFANDLDTYAYKLDYDNEFTRDNLEQDLNEI